MISKSTFDSVQISRFLVYLAPLLLVLGLLAACMFDVIREWATVPDFLNHMILWAKKIYWRSCDEFLLDPIFYVGVPAVFFLQAFLPVNRNQPAFGVATFTDLFFTLMMVAFFALVAPAFYGYLRFLYHDVMGVPQIQPLVTLPRWGQLVLGYLLVDFLGWLHHLVRHKVPVFWEFHAVHHAQTDMNPFTRDRVHPVDWFVANTIKFLPAFAFKDSLGIVLAYIIIHRFLDHLNHSNVRTNLGWFRFIFVTPQSHRVHHSKELTHRDCNFGVSLSIWDHLFRTQCRDYDCYPRTGVEDPRYPLENSAHPVRFVACIVRQLIHPFANVARISQGKLRATEEQVAQSQRVY